MAVQRPTRPSAEPPPGSTRHPVERVLRAQAERLRIKDRLLNLTHAVVRNPEGPYTPLPLARKVREVLDGAS